MPQSPEADPDALVYALVLSLKMQEEEATDDTRLLVASRQKVHRVQGPLSSLLFLEIYIIKSKSKLYSFFPH